MIKLTAFYPFSNFLRVTQEFYEDSAIVKSKSLTFESEFNFKYEDVGEISDGFYISKDQQSFGGVLTAITGTFLFALYGNLLWLRIGQLLFIIGLLLLITSFIRSWYIFIIDKNGGYSHPYQTESPKQRINA